MRHLDTFLIYCSNCQPAACDNIECDIEKSNLVLVDEASKVKLWRNVAFLVKSLICGSSWAASISHLLGSIPTNWPGVSDLFWYSRICLEPRRHPVPISRILDSGLAPLSLSNSRTHLEVLTWPIPPTYVNALLKLDEK